MNSVIAGGKMPKEKMSKDDLRWQTESDLDALVRADLVKHDNVRLKAAIIMAGTKAQEEVKEAKAFKKISKMNYQTLKGKNIDKKLSQMSDEELFR